MSPGRPRVALPINTVGAAANLTLNSTPALLIGAAVRSALILATRSECSALARAADGTAANIALNPTLALPIGDAVRSALILVIHPAALGPFEPSCLEIAYGVVLAVIFSANICDTGGKEAIVSTARRTIIERGQQYTLDDVDHAIVRHGHVLLPKFNVRILLSCIVQLGLPFANLLDFNVETTANGGEVTLSTEVLDGHPPACGMICENFNKCIAEDDVVVTYQIAEDVDVPVKNIISVATAVVPEIVSGRPAEGLIVGCKQGEILEESVYLVLDVGCIDQLQKDAESLFRTGRIGQILEKLVSGEILISPVYFAVVEG